MQSGKGALIAALVLGIVHIYVTYASHREADKIGIGSPLEYSPMILVSVLVTFAVLVCNSYAASKEEDKDAQIIESVAAVCAFVVIVYTIVRTRVLKTWEEWAPEDYPLTHYKNTLSPKRRTLAGVFVYTVQTLVAVTKTR